MDLFAHRIHKSELVNGVVRLEFSILKANSKGEYDPEASVSADEVTFTANMPLSGFMRSMAVLREMTQELQKKGVLKGQENDQARGGKPRMLDITKDDSDDKIV